MTFTFGEIKLFSEILKRGYDLNNFTPKVFYDLTEGNTMFKYSDVCAMLKFYGTSSEDGSLKRIHDVVEDFKNKIYTAAVENNINLNNQDDLNAFASQYYAKEIALGVEESSTMNPIDGNLVRLGNMHYPQEIVQLHNSFNTLKSICTNTTKILKDSVKQHNPRNNTSMMNSVMEKARDALFFQKESIKKQKNYLTQKVSDAIEFNKTYDFLAFTSSQTLNNFEFPTNVANLGKIIKKVPTNNTDGYEWREISKDGVDRYDSTRPFSGLFNEILSGNNETYCCAFPVPKFDKHGEFESFSTVPDLTDRFAYTRNIKVDKIAEYLESKKFGVRKNPNDATEYNVQDLVYGSWDCMEKNDKIEVIKASLGTLTAGFAASIVRMQDCLSSPDFDEFDLQSFAFGTFTTQASAIASARNLLSCLYISETNLDVKLSIETAIVTLGECAKIIKTGTIYDLAAGYGIDQDTMKQKNDMLKVFDEEQPVKLLKYTNNLTKAELGAKQFINLNIATNFQVAPQKTKSLIIDKADSIQREIDHLGSNVFKRFFNADRIKVLQNERDCLAPAYTMFNEIYDQNLKVKKSDPQNNPTPTLVDKITNAFVKHPVTINAPDGTSTTIDQFHYTHSDDATYSARHSLGGGIFKDNNNLLSRIKRAAAIFRHCRVANCDCQATFGQLPLNVSDPAPTTAQQMNSNAPAAVVVQQPAQPINPAHATVFDKDKIIDQSTT